MSLFEPRRRLPALFALLLAACAPKLTVRAEADPSADFNQYRTWNFFPQLGIEGGNNSPVFGEHFRAAIEREMLERGQIRPVVDRSFGVEQLTEALRYQDESRAPGKVVITI